MKRTSVNSEVLGIAAGLCAAAVVGTAVGCTVKAAGKSKMPNIKKSAKKALRNVEHYIDTMM